MATGKYSSASATPASAGIVRRHARARHRDLLRRDRRRALRHRARPRRRRAALAGRDARGLRRRRARARLARPRPARAAADASTCSRAPGSACATSTRSPTRRGPGSPARCSSARASRNALGFALGKPVLGIHHLEGHLLSPLLGDAGAGISVRRAARVGRPHAVLRRRRRRPLRAARRHAGRRRRRSVRQDREAARLAYPGGPALAALAEQGSAGAIALPRPMLDRGDLDFSFSGLKTAVALRARDAGDGGDPAQLAVVAQGRHRSRVPGRRRRRARRQGAAGARRDRAARARRRRRRRRQPRVARAARARARRARRARVLSRAAILHRQRRDDRDGGGACSSRDARMRRTGVFRAAALAVAKRRPRRRKRPSLPDRALAPAQQLPDVGAMPPEQQQRDGDARPTLRRRGRAHRTSRAAAAPRS